MVACPVKHTALTRGAARAGAAAMLALVPCRASAEVFGLELGPLDFSSTDPVLVAVCFFGGLLSGGFFFAWMSARRRAAHALVLVDELQSDLDEAASIIAAEPHFLFVWRGRELHPSQIAGDLRGMKGIPGDYEGRINFGGWMENRSHHRLQEAISELRMHGTPFNMVVRTLAGELLEADGRAAAGLATLRLRMLTGERLEMSKLAEDYAQLERQADALTAILDRAPMPIWFRDAEGRMTWANAAFAQAVDMPDARTAMASGAELVDAEDRKRALKATADGRSLRSRLHGVINGERRALDVVEMPIAQGSAGLVFDVTELEQAENELSRHTKAHASTLDKIATAVAIFGPDQRLRFFNTSYAQLWQLEPSWLNEKPTEGEILDRLRAERKLPEQADYRAWKNGWLQALQNSEDREDLWHLPDGRTLRVITEQHSFGGVTNLYENVTELISLESRYNSLISVQRETLDNLHEGVALFGSDGRLKLYNPAYAEIWQLDEELLGSEPHVTKVIAACRKSFDDDIVWDELKIGVTSLDDARHPQSARLNRPDDTIVDFSSVPLPDGATLLIYVDVTDTTRIERALRERNDALETADRLKSEFISHVSYELRTPLTNIIGFTESLTLGMVGDLTQRQGEYTNHILSSSRTLLAIIDDILDLATIDAGVMELDMGPVSVAGMLKAAAGLVQDRISSRGLILEIEVAANAGTFCADERRMKQILFNLLSNAVGFSPPGGRIGMGARREGEEIVVWVSDTGVGIDPELQPSVFDRFESRSGGSRHRGAGLGLSVVKSFVELHGGSVDLRSTPGEGTTVVCRFPVDGPALPKPDGTDAEPATDEADSDPAQTDAPALKAAGA